MKKWSKSRFYGQSFSNSVRHRATELSELANICFREPTDEWRAKLTRLEGSIRVEVEIIFTRYATVDFFSTRPSMNNETKTGIM